MTSSKDFRTIQKKIFFSKTDIPILYGRTIDDIDQHKAHEYIQLISDYFFHRKPASIQKFERSTLHSVYKVAVGSHSYIIRISKLNNYFSDFSLELEEFISKHLKKYSIASPKIITTDRSRKIIPYDYQISAYVEGDLLYSLYKKEKNQDLLFFELGKMIAHVHKIKTEGYGPFDISFAEKKKLKGIHSKWSTYIFLNLELHLDYCNDHGIVDQVQYNHLHKLFHKEIQKSDTVTPVLLHGDIANHNVICKNGKIVSILDWEDAISGDPVFEIAYYGTGLYKHKKQIQNFLDGYTSESSIKISAEFWRRYWLFFIRISISKAVSRHVLGEKVKSGAPDISERIMMGIKNFK